MAVMACSRSALAISSVPPLAIARPASSTMDRVSPSNSAVSAEGNADISGHRGARGEHLARGWADAFDFQVEHPRGIETQNVALGRLIEEGERPDRARRVEVPMRPIRGKQQLGLGLHGRERRLQKLEVAFLQRLTGEVHLTDVLARWTLEHGRLANAHHELMIEPLHDERYPGKPALYPDQLQFWEALRQAVDDPVGEMDETVVHERQRVHGDEAVELQEGRVAPV